MNKSQEQIIKDHLLKHGYVSRNWCLQRMISRLSARIYDLRERGLEIEGYTGKQLGLWDDNDYYYLLSDCVNEDITGRKFVPKTDLKGFYQLKIKN